MAPTEEASAIGHALTLRRPLRLEQIADSVYAVDGTPTDCVNIAVTQIFTGAAGPRVSGINKGWNLGDDVTYSGTVAGALEARAARRTGTGSVVGAHARGIRLQLSARAAAAIAAAMFRRPLPPWTFLNVNCPKGQPKGFRTTVQAKRNHVTRCRSATIPRGGRTTGSTKGRTNGSRTTGRIPGGARRVRVGDAAASGPDGAPCAFFGRRAIFRNGSQLR